MGGSVSENCWDSRTMRIVSYLLRRTIYPFLAKTGFFHSWGVGKMREYLTVVTYHGVLPPNYEVKDRWQDGHLVSTDMFRQQLHYLKSHYNVISPEDLYACLLGNDRVHPGSVLLTCDDGLLNNVTDMLPILKEEGLSCLFFVTTASLCPTLTMFWLEELYLMLKLGRGGAIQIPIDAMANYSIPGDIEQRRAVWWQLVKELSKVDHQTRQSLIDNLRVACGLPKDWKSVFIKDPMLRRRFFVLSPSKLKVLLDAGMTLGSHTCTHPVLALLPSQLSWHEIKESRRELEQSLGIRVWALAYPFGDPRSVTERELVLAERAGYRCAFVNFEGSVNMESPFCFHRVHVTGEMSAAEFEAHVSGVHWILRHKLFPSKSAAVAS
jgi:peptidoglycan/xylan/chitin deacetylase (PgdA/CDA1 family)